MKNLIIRKRPSKNDDFFLALQYDSRNYGFPFPFGGYELFVNNDQQPLATLLINQKKLWAETVDLKKLLGPGTYTLRLRTIVWTDPGNKTSAFFMLKVGDAMNVGSYPIPTPPRPLVPLPEWKEYERQQKKGDATKFLEEHWDQWTVDYGV